MTDDEHIAMVELINEFWHKFSTLCNETLKKAPAHLQGEAEMMMQEHASVYGRKISR